MSDDRAACPPPRLSPRVRNDFDLLPEIPIPQWVNRAALERLARRHHTPVLWAEGNPRGSIAIVLDNSGQRGRRCTTRSTLLDAVRTAGMPIRELYVTWLAKFWPRRAYDKEQVRTLGRMLVEREIREIAPRVIVGMGDVVAQTLLRDPDAHVRELRGHTLKFAGRPLVVSYHPLAARRRPNLFPRLVEDLKTARRVTRPVHDTPDQVY